MERILLLSHAVSGGLVLLIGLLNFLNRKGAKYHRLFGKIYVGTMWWLCLSAFLIISFYRFSFFLMVIGILTFYSSFVGVRVVRRKKPGTESWYDWAVAAITGLFGVGLIIYGIRFFVLTEGFHLLGMLSLIFGFITLQSGVRDLRFFNNSRRISEKRWWLYQHVGAMGGSYIAAITAFAVQNSEVFIPNDSLNWLAWIVPAIIGTPVISLINRKYRRKYESTTQLA